MLKFHLFTFIISLFLLSNAEKTPDMVVILTRHGAREPYSSDWDNSWRNSQEVVDGGVEQSYVLGLVLAEVYADLLKDIDMKEITAYATYLTRTEMTVSAMLLGLFRKGIHDHTKDLSKKDFMLPYVDQGLVNKVIDGVLAKPEVIPNRMQLLHQNLVTYKANDSMTFEPTGCWLIFDSVPKRIKDETNQKMYAEIEETVKKVRDLGYPARNLAEFTSTADIMLSRYADNRPAMPGIPYDGKVFKEMSFALHWWTLYNFVGPDSERAARIYPFYRNMISWFKERISGEINTKLILIGGHESAMFPFLNLHQIVNSTCYHANYKAEKAGKPMPYPECITPDFAAQMTYELYDINTPAPYIKMLYNGKAFKICPESEGVECPLSEFERMFSIWTSDMTEEEFQAQCVWPGEASSLRLKNAMPVVTGILGVIIGLLPYCLKVEKGKTITQYAKHIKKTGLTLLTPKFSHIKMTEDGDEENSQKSAGIEIKMEKDIVSP